PGDVLVEQPVFGHGQVSVKQRLGDRFRLGEQVMLVVRCASTGVSGCRVGCVAGPIGSAVGDVGDVAGWLLAGFELRPGHGDVVGAGGWFGLEAAAVAVVEVAADDMEDSGYRDGGA